jgi:stearoyl-CoA 9-desaturase NADPH oxidoreductase
MQFRPLQVLLSSRFVTALAAPHGVGHYLELFAPRFSLSETRAIVVDVRRETRDCATLLLRPNARWTGHEAGQYVSVGVEIGGVRHSRCFSVASSPLRRDGRLAFTVKASDSGFVSRSLVHDTRVGRMLWLSPAEGRFVLPVARPEDLLLISGGSGITPVMSMLRALIDEQYPGDVTFLHYARSTAELIYREELDAIASTHRNVRIVRAFTRSDDGELRGRFSASHLTACAPRFAACETYVCGPEALLRDVRTIWEANAIASRLHEERFALSSAARALTEGDARGTLQFARTGLQTASRGLTLLEEAETAGLRPAFGCRMGICKTCLCRKIHGTVRDLRTGTTSDEISADIQLCVSSPIGDVTIDL